MGNVDGSNTSFIILRDGYQNRLKKDNIKKEYCIKNNIKLIEISYKDYKNIENILIKELNLNP